MVSYVLHQITMKMKNSLRILAGGAFFSILMLAGGCNSTNGLFGKSNSSKSQTVKEDAVLPRDREQIGATEDLKTYTAEDIKNGTVKGDWAIEKVNGKKTKGEKAPYLRFDPSQKMVYGYNGCNYLNGPYSYNATTHALSFGDLASTMMMCQMEGITDYDINVALSQVKSYDWEAIDSEYYLYLRDAAGKEVMTLMHQNFDFLNGTWLVKQIDDTAVNDPEMKMVIDVDEGKIHGNTGCNLYNGAMEIDMEEANSISFSSIGVTRMACPDPNHETALLVALEEASTARPVSKNEVRLLNSQGKQVLRLVRTTDR